MDPGATGISSRVPSHRPGTSGRSRLGEPGRELAAGLFFSTISSSWYPTSRRTLWSTLVSVVSTAWDVLTAGWNVVPWCVRGESSCGGAAG